MLTAEDYFKRFKDSSEIIEDYKKNAELLLSLVNDLLATAGHDHPIITSGFRTTMFNAACGGSKNSSHCTAMAIDLADPDKSLGVWCTSHPEELIKRRLYMESLSCTHKGDQPSSRWVHLTTCRPRSGHTIFFPVLALIFHSVFLS